MLSLPRLLATTPSTATQPPSPPCGCDQDPVAALKQLFVDFFQGHSIAAGRDPATRPVFLRLHGAAHGRFLVRPDLPPELQVGVFGQQIEYPAWVRFSSDVQPGQPDLKGTVGIGIKLFEVGSEKLSAADRHAVTHDFLLQNFDIFFVDTARDMCEFTCASLNGKFDEYVAQHPLTGEILDAMSQVVDSALTASYWSVLPFRFGERFVKYKLEPAAAPPGTPPDHDDPFYLRADLQARLSAGEARFRFLLQFQTDETAMPLDRATARWSEQASPPVHLATLVLPQQDLDTRGQSAYGERLAFDTWHALPVHRPVGSIADARRVAYPASAEARRNVNGEPVGEPIAPRPAQWRPGEPYPPAMDTTVVRAAIHPAIGVARVGNSASEYLIGPEVPEPPAPGTAFRDAGGALKRQAACFRIYGYNAAGAIVRELTADWARIRWTVHVANRKAAWYRWDMALDVPEAAGLKLPQRNPTVTGADRAGLVIDGGPRTIEGKGTSGSDYAFNGSFMGVAVYLGELRTDEAGRLLFLGGRGVSATPTGSPIYDPADPSSFINADGWYDDTSDGPVTAEVNIEGRPIPVDPAWVITAPPNYAPALFSVRTLYDLLLDLFVQARQLAPPAPVSFAGDVYPILRRLSLLQWVNRGFATQFGWDGPYDFTDPAFVARLAREPGQDDRDGELRRQVLNAFRPPEPTDNNPLPWPWVYGDAMDVPPAATPRQNASVSGLQYRMLQAWAAGQFVADGAPAHPRPTDLAQVPLAEQPATLDRAALEFCLADAFHPGCELTWPVRHLTLYDRPFRIRHRPPGTPEPDYGPTLTPAIALSPDGPLHAQGPGDLTRWMGLPWQADTAFCRSGYAKEYDPYIPTFWPARVPNQVLTEEAYAIVMDPTLPLDERLGAFAGRDLWTRAIDAFSRDTAKRMERMVQIFGEMGVVEPRDGPTDPAFPAALMVESTGRPPTAPAQVRPAAAAALEPRLALQELAIREAGETAAADIESWPLPVRHPKQGA
jgi:L-lysine epsilon oxidase-like protein